MAFALPWHSIADRRGLLTGTARRRLRRRGGTWCIASSPQNKPNLGKRKFASAAQHVLGPIEQPATFDSRGIPANRCLIRSQRTAGPARCLTPHVVDALCANGFFGRRHVLLQVVLIRPSDLPATPAGSGRLLDPRLSALQLHWVCLPSRGRTRGGAVKFSEFLKCFVDCNHEQTIAVR